MSLHVPVMCHKGPQGRGCHYGWRACTRLDHRFQAPQMTREAVIGEYGDRTRLLTLEEIIALSTRCMHKLRWSSVRVRLTASVSRF